MRDPEAGVQITQLFVIHAEMLLVSDYETHLNGNFRNVYEDLVAVSLNIQFFRFVKFNARAVYVNVARVLYLNLHRIAMKLVA